MASLGGNFGSTTIKHCVQNAELTFEQTYHAEPELSGRGGDLGVGIPMAAVGSLIIVAETQRRDDLRYSGPGSQTTAGYVVGGALLAAGVGFLVNTFVIGPGKKPPPGPVRVRRRVDTQLVESSGCGLPGDIGQIQPAYPVVARA